MTQTRIGTKTLESAAASLDPKMPQLIQGSCSSLGSILRKRLTLTVLCINRVGAATTTHSVSDNKEVRQKPLVPQMMTLSIYSVRNLPGDTCRRDLLQEYLSLNRGNRNTRDRSIM